MLCHWKNSGENQVGRVDLIINWMYDCTECMYIVQVSHNCVTYISQYVWNLCIKYQHIYNYAYYLIDIDKVSHVLNTNFILCFYTAHMLFWSVLQGKALSEIFRVQAASGIVQFSSGSCYLPARIMNPAGCKLWIYNPLTAWSWNIFDKKLLFSSIMNSRIANLSRLTSYYRLLSNSDLD